MIPIPGTYTLPAAIHDPGAGLLVERWSLATLKGSDVSPRVCVSRSPPSVVRFQSGETSRIHVHPSP